MVDSGGGNRGGLYLRASTGDNQDRLDPRSRSSVVRAPSRLTAGAIEPTNSWQSGVAASKHILNFRYRQGPGGTAR